MNKKHFLFLLPVCLVFCLWFTTCEEEKEVTDLWDKLRNTVWTNNGKYNEGGKEYNYSCTIGFYAPNKGPYANYNAIYKNVSPYFLMRWIWINKSPYPEWFEAGRYHGFRIDNMEINRTGNKISESGFYSDGKPYTWSFNISVSGDKLTISNANFDVWLNGVYTKISSDPNYDWNQYSDSGRK